MLKNKKIIVVMPAYNAAATLKTTYDEIMQENIVDEIILVDDASTDGTIEVAKTLEHLVVHKHDNNRGYGGNQKTCYKLALDHGADIVIMIHPDYQYTPKLIPAMAGMIVNGLYQLVLGSRILGGGSLSGGMPLYKYVANRFLTLIENMLTGAKLSEYHTGYRAYSADLLRKLPIEKNSDDFVFDNQLLVQALWIGGRIGEVSCPTSYHPDASSINFARSVKYGFGCIGMGLAYRLAKLGITKHRIFENQASSDKQ